MEKFIFINKKDIMKKIIIREDQGNMLFQRMQDIKDSIEGIKNDLLGDVEDNVAEPVEEVPAIPAPCPCKMAKQFPINPEKVLIVKKFLDGNFGRGDFEEIGDDGMPRVTRIVIMKGPSGNPLKNMFMDQLQDLLQEKFKNMFSEEDEKRKFLGQVMRDWYDNKIGLYGSLSVNHL